MLCCFANRSSICRSRALVSTGLALPNIEAAGTPDGGAGAAAAAGAFDGGPFESSAAAAAGGGRFSIGFVRGARFNLGRVRGSAVKKGDYDKSKEI